MIVVTGATGKLGRLVVEGLVKTVSARRIVAAVWTPGKAGDLVSLGVSVRAADYSKPGTLPTAPAGAGKVLLISSSEVGQRVPQHKAVVDAAKAVGVKGLFFTSFFRADSAGLIITGDLKATEDCIRESAVPYRFKNRLTASRECTTMGVRCHPVDSADVQSRHFVSEYGK